MGFTSLQPAPGETFYSSSVDVNLTEIETIIKTAGFARINLFSDDTSAINRQILLEPSNLEGQQITLTLLSDGGTTCLLSTLSTSYVRLEASWTPVQYGQITLQWTKGLWIEITRSSEGSGEFKPVITSPQSGDLLIYDGSEWINHQLEGQFTLDGTGSGNFRHVSNPQNNDVLTYDSATQNWINAPVNPNTLVWEACTTQPHFSGTIEVASYGNSLKVLRGTLTSTDGTNDVMAVLPSGYELTGTRNISGQSTSGTAVLGATIYKINIADISLNSLSSTIFAGYTFNFDNVFFIKE